MCNEEAAEGAFLSHEGEPQRDCFLVGEGEVEVLSEGRLHATIGRGGFLGEIPLLYGSGKQHYSYRLRTPGVVYRLGRRDLADFLKKNPGLHLRLSSQRY
ncbi:Cyclic nucleotide-binding domain protein [compost metagenome]